MIGVTCDQTEVTYGDTITADYVVFTPGQEVTDELIIRVYGVEDGEQVDYAENTLVNVPNNILYTWDGTSYRE